MIFNDGNNNQETQSTFILAVDNGLTYAVTVFLRRYTPCLLLWRLIRIKNN